jgi:hypothetical protein
VRAVYVAVPRVIGLAHQAAKGFHRVALVLTTVDWYFSRVTGDSVPSFYPQKTESFSVPFSLCNRLERHAVPLLVQCYDPRPVLRLDPLDPFLVRERSLPTIAQAAADHQVPQRMFSTTAERDHVVRDLVRREHRGIAIRAMIRSLLERGNHLAIDGAVRCVGNPPIPAFLM